MGKGESNLFKWSWTWHPFSPSGRRQRAANLFIFKHWASFMIPAFQNKPKSDDLWHMVCMPQDVNNSINTFLSACLWPFLITSWNSTGDHTEYEVSMINQRFAVLWLWFNQRLLLCAAQHFRNIIIKLSHCSDILLHTEMAFRTVLANRKLSWGLQQSEAWEDCNRFDLDRDYPLAIILNDWSNKLRRKEYLMPYFQRPAQQVSNIQAWLQN